MGEKGQYIDIDGNIWDLSDMTLEKLIELNYSEETQFAKKLLTFPPFSNERSEFMRYANKKIMQIAFWKKKASGLSSAAKNYGATSGSIKMLQGLIQRKRHHGNSFIVYEAGVGKATALRQILDADIQFYGCDVFLSDEARQFEEKNNNNVHLWEKDLFLALNEIADFSIDLFYADNVLEHLPPDEFEETVRRIAQKVKPDGCCFFVIPNRYAGPSDISRSFLPAGAKAQGFHYMEQTFAENVRVFSQMGLMLDGLCLVTGKKRIIYLPTLDLLNPVKLKLEPLIGKIGRVNLRRMLIKRMGYTVYVLTKEDGRNG